MRAIGAELKKEREARGVSLADIAASTKIGRRYFEALEEDRLEDLQGSFFAKGTIRAYAKAIGLDDQEVMRRYAEAGFFGRPEEPMTLKTVAGPSRSHSVLFTVLAIIAVALLTIGISKLLKPSPSPPAAPTIAETPLSAARPVVLPPPADAAAAPGPTAAAPAGQAATEQAAPTAATAGLVLELELIHETWIQVDADGRRVLDGLLPAGFRFRVTAGTEILMNLGNAGGLSFLLNGKKGRSYGPLGAVVKGIRITPENVRDHLAPEEGRND
jgi:cytoskeletal protein RodZ